MPANGKLSIDVEVVVLTGKKYIKMDDLEVLLN